MNESCVFVDPVWNLLMSKVIILFRNHNLRCHSSVESFTIEDKFLKEVLRDRGINDVNVDLVPLLGDSIFCSWFHILFEALAFLRVINNPITLRIDLLRLKKFLRFEQKLLQTFVLASFNVSYCLHPLL